MDDRQRFLNCVSFKDTDRFPLWEWGFRSDTTARWHKEGLPPSVPDQIGWTEFLGLDRGAGYAGGVMAEKVGLDFQLSPDFAGMTLQEDERTATVKNEWGAVVKTSKVGESIPQYLSFGVETRHDFQEYAKRWNPSDPARYPNDWSQRKQRWKHRDYPISLFTYGWYGILRELMGVENLSVAFHFDAPLIDEICEYWGDFLIGLFHKALKETDVDYILFWEDLAFKTGPLLSPEHFRRYLLPHYRRVIDHCRQLGVNHFMVDSDGNIEKIIPLWLEAGIDMLGPFEVTAGMDVVQIRRTYHKELAMVGGIDKIALMGSRQDIDAEIRRRVEPVVFGGGYIPTLDHSAVPEISYANFMYYRETLHSLCS